GNFRVTDNLAVTPADYSPYCITAPVNPGLPGGGGFQTCGLYDVVPSKFGQVNNLVTKASNFGDQTEVYNGIEVAINARFGKGGLITGGYSTGQTVTNNCFAVDSPQQLRYCQVTTPWAAQGQIKLQGVYPLPLWDIQAAATYQNIAGPPDNTTYV